MRKTIWGEEGYKEVLPCGCIPGEFLCEKAQELWKQYLKLQEEGNISHALLARQEYNRHLGKKSKGDFD